MLSLSLAAVIIALETNGPMNADVFPTCVTQDQTNSENSYL